MDSTDKKIETAGTPEPIAFRHKTIRRFNVGKFSFKNHICVVQDEDIAEFEECLRGLKHSDSCQIFQLKAIRNETPMVDGRVTRGAATSEDPELKGKHERAVAELEDLKNQKKALQDELDEAAKHDKMSADAIAYADKRATTAEFELQKLKSAQDAMASAAKSGTRTSMPTPTKKA